MDNSKIEPIFPYFFIFIFIFALISQKWLKKWVKKFFLRFPRKFPYNLILIWRIHGSNSFSQNFLFTSPFLLQLVKMSQKMSQYFLFRFSAKLSCNLILIWRIQISNLYFQFFLSSFSFLPQLIKKWLTKWVKECLLNFSWKFPYTIFIPINARDVYLRIWLFRGALIQEGHLIERDVYLQIRSIVDMFFSFNTWQAIEKTTNLHYHLFICFILDHIHFLLASSSSEGEMNGLTASLSSTKIELGGQLLPSSFARLFLF